MVPRNCQMLVGRFVPRQGWRGEAMLTPHWYRTCNHALVWLNAEVLNGWTYSNQCESPLSTKRLIPSSLNAALMI